jgi:hypothetical protein
MAWKTRLRNDYITDRVHKGYNVQGSHHTFSTRTKVPQNLEWRGAAKSRFLRSSLSCRINDSSAAEDSWLNFLAGCKIYSNKKTNESTTSTSRKKTYIKTQEKLIHSDWMEMRTCSLYCIGRTVKTLVTFLHLSLLVAITSGLWPQNR